MKNFTLSLSRKLRNLVETHCNACLPDRQASLPRRVFFITILFLGLFFGLNGKASAETYYVDCNATNDDGTGTTEGTAWKTIAKVNASTFLPDDNILFKRGCTFREQLTVPSSGSDGHPITFGAYGSGNRPIINGSDLATGWIDNSGSTENDGSSTNTNTTSLPTNTLMFVKVTTTNGGVLQSYHIYFGASYPPKVKMALYSDSSNYPGTLLGNSQSEEIIPSAGWNTAAVYNVPQNSDNHTCCIC